MEWIDFVLLVSYKSDIFFIKFEVCSCNVIYYILVICCYVNGFEYNFNESKFIVIIDF